MGGASTRMRLALAILLQLLGMGLAYWGIPAALVGAGICPMAVIFIRAQFTVREG